MINKLFNKRQLDLLSEAEEYFIQVKNGFKRNSPHALDVKVYNVLNEVEATQEPKWSCSKCIFDLYRKCAKVYNDSKEFYKNEQMEKENARQQPTNTNSNPTATRQSSNRIKRKSKKNSSN